VRERREREAIGRRERGLVVPARVVTTAMAVAVAVVVRRD